MKSGKNLKQIKLEKRARYSVASHSAEFVSPSAPLSPEIIATWNGGQICLTRTGGARLLGARRPALDKLLGSLGGRKSKNPPSPFTLLTVRELEVFKLIGLARQTREIARELNMSVKTVEVHRANIKQKLKVKTGPELTRLAVLWVALLESLLQLLNSAVNGRRSQSADFDGLENSFRLDGVLPAQENDVVQFNVGQARITD